MSSIIGPGASPRATPMDPSSQMATIQDMNAVKTAALNEMQQMLAMMGGQMKSQNEELAGMVAALEGLKGAKTDLAMTDKLAQLEAKLAELEKAGKKGAPPPDPRVVELTKTAEGLKKALASMPAWSPIKPILQATLAGIERQIADLTPKAPTPKPQLDPKIVDMMKTVEHLKTVMAVLPPFARAPIAVVVATLQRQIDEAVAKSTPPPIDPVKKGMEAEIEKMRAMIDALKSQQNQLVDKMGGMMDKQNEMLAQLMDAMTKNADSMKSVMKKGAV